MISALPKLRPDLLISQHDTEAGPSLVIKDPVSGRFYRLGGTERFIAEQLDGHTTLSDVRKRAEQRFNASLPDETLSAFLATLGKAGLLEGTAAESPAAPSRWKRIRGNILYLRVPIFDPDRVLTRLAEKLRFLFTRRSVMIAGALVLIALGITLSNRAEIAADVSRLYRLNAIPLFLAVILVVGSIHEFGHGVTCKWFGGEVHEVGFMLMYFQPAFYCNVSDAWLFPERAKRLWVGAAGPLFELTIWSVATMLWRVTESDTWINYVALTVMMISGIKSLFNLNPFIKFDGYYLLSDYLEIPNLRARSFRYVGDVFRRLVHRGAPAGPEIPGRERAAYLVYGLVASVISLSLLGFLFIGAGGYFLGRHQIIPLLLLGYIGITSVRSYRRMYWGAPAEPHAVEKVESHAVATVSSGPLPAPAGHSVLRRLSPRSRKRLAVAVVGVLFLLIGHRQLRIGGPFDVLPQGNADVRAAVSGIVEEVFVDEGAVVKAGDPIARLSDRDLRAELLRIEAQISGIQANVDRLQAGPTPAEVRLARAAVSKASDEVRFARSTLVRSKGMFQQQVLSTQELENDQQRAAAASNDLADARARLNVLVKGARPEEIAATRAQYDALMAQKHLVEQQIQLLNIGSPVAGVVATPSRELHAMKGQLVATGALIAKVYEVKTVTAQITVPEKEIADVHLGQPVQLRSRAYPSRTFRGTVTAIATAAQGTLLIAGAAPVPVPEPTSTTRTFLVTTQIDNREMLLKPGMTGEAKVYCGDRRIIGLITRRLARIFKVDLWSML